MLKQIALRIPQIHRLYEQRDELQGRLTTLEAELRASRKETAQQRDLLKVVNGELGKLRSENKQPPEISNIEPRDSREVDVCRSLANKCVFVIGYARSSTTLTLQMLNTSERAFLLGEANFFLDRDWTSFRSEFNKQHVGFKNQKTKSTYAPDLLPYQDNTWWEYLNELSHNFKIVGEKIALSSFHINKMGEDGIQDFFEARFLQSKYIFLIRNPIDTLISTLKLIQRDKPEDMLKECDAWLRYVKIWANFVRIFPNTKTFIADDFGSSSVPKLEQFVGIDLPVASSVFRPERRTKHDTEEKYAALVGLEEEFRDIFESVKFAAAKCEELGTIAFESGQQNSSQRVAFKGDRPDIHSLAQVWTKAENLRARLPQVGTDTTAS